MVRAPAAVSQQESPGVPARVAIRDLPVFSPSSEPLLHEILRAPKRLPRSWALYMCRHAANIILQLRYTCGHTDGHASRQSLTPGHFVAPACNTSKPTVARRSGLPVRSSPPVILLHHTGILCPHLVQSRESRVSRAPQTPLQRVTPISIAAHRCITTATVRHVILIPSPPTPCKCPIVEGAHTQWAGSAAFENPEPLARGQRMQMRRLMRTGTRRVPRLTYHLRPGSLPYTPGARYS